jgi:hypothetical protein
VGGLPGVPTATSFDSGCCDGEPAADALLLLLQSLAESVLSRGDADTVARAAVARRPGGPCACASAPTPQCARTLRTPGSVRGGAAITAFAAAAAAAAEDDDDDVDDEEDDDDDGHGHEKRDL